MENLPSLPRKYHPNNAKINPELNAKNYNKLMYCLLNIQSLLEILEFRRKHYQDGLRRTYPSIPLERTWVYKEINRTLAKTIETLGEVLYSIQFGEERTK